MGELKVISSRKLKALIIIDAIILALIVGVSWVLVYVVALEPLIHGGFSKLIHLLLHPRLTETLWWRDFLEQVFNILIVFEATAGTWWTLGNFAVSYREIRKWKEYYKREGKQDVWVVRFGVWERVQHFIVFITMATCIFTGFVMYFGNNPYWKFFYTNRDLFVKIHVISGVIMGALAIIHIIYYTAEAIVAKARGEKIMDRFPLLKLFTKTDILNYIKAYLWLLTPRIKPGPADKYGPEEEFEYWGVYWGMIVLGIPGAIMALYGPKVLDGIFWVTHVKEAVVATIYLLIVHMGYTHLRPEVFPIEPSFITGKMPLKRVKEEYPRWYERLVKKGVVKG
ncbi:cytochrome b/b6 domain-containing protein [Stetteria hydrogenophila]